mgnify:CR=1 FL=1
MVCCLDRAWGTSPLQVRFFFMIDPRMTQAESAVIGALLVDDSTFRDVQSVLEERDFYNNDLRKIFGIICRLRERGLPADVITVADALGADDEDIGLQFVGELANRTASTMNVLAHAELVRDHSRKRQLSRLSRNVQERVDEGATLEDLKTFADDEMTAIFADVDRATFDINDWTIEKQYLGDAGPIDWLIEGVLPTGTAGMVSSFGGVGKSYLLMDACIRIAAGPGITGQYAFGGKVAQSGRVVMITAEDSRRAVHRRIDQIIQEPEKQKIANNLHLVSLVDAGGHVAFLKVVNGQYTMTPAWSQLCDQIARFDDVKLIVLDPLQTLVTADINADPAAAQVWWSAVSKLCARSGAAVLVAHHMRKEQGEIDSPAAAKTAVRGTTALIDGSRFCYCLWPAPNADRIKVEEATGDTIPYLGLVHGAVVKSNEFATTDVHTYLRDPLTGLLVECTDRVADALDGAGRLNGDQLSETFKEINARWDAGSPFSKAVQSDRFLGTWLCTTYGLGKGQAKTLIKEWMDKQYLTQEWVPRLKMNGLRGA